jgi:hypothetical protein
MGSMREAMLWFNPCIPDPVMHMEQSVMDIVSKVRVVIALVLVLLSMTFSIRPEQDNASQLVLLRGSK